MMNELADRIKEYIHYERVDEYRETVKRLVAEDNKVELDKLFRNRLTFGTAGIRGCMGPGYSQMNDLVIIQTTQGLVGYLIECHGVELCKQRGVIIGHDARHNSDRFARLAALAFLSKDIPVFFSEHIVPTPLIAFGVTKFNCLCGIVITASHNPKQDNGYKVYWSNGAQILSPHDKNIQRHIEKPENRKPWDGAWQHDRLTTNNILQSRSNITTEEYSSSSLSGFGGLFRPVHALLFTSYNDYIKRLVDDQRDQNQTAGISITYTTMHGVGHAFLTKALELAGFDDIFPVEAQRKPDPNFSTVKFPNPEETGALDLAFETALHANSSLILANDPDADRCAAALFDTATKSRRVLTGNEIGALLGWWSWYSYQERLSSQSVGQAANSFNDEPEDQDQANTVMGTLNEQATPVIKRPEDCYMLSTAVSSRFLQSMAKVEGFKFIETLTGFKYMGNVAYDLINNQNKSVLFAYEEAIGYMVDPQILDKDGISAAVQLAQCAAHLKSIHKRTLASQLDWLYLRYGYHYSINSYFICRDQRIIHQIFHALQSDYPKFFGSEVEPNEFKVTRIRDLNNGFDNGSTDNKATLPISASSFMVTFFIGSEIQFTIRTSGTEPKIKYYSEIVSELPKEVSKLSTTSSNDELRQEAMMETQARLRRFVDAAIERCLKPASFNLEAAD